MASLLENAWAHMYAQTEKPNTQGDSDVSLLHIYDSWFSPPYTHTPV